MRKRYSLKELEHLLPVLDANEQKAIMGGGSGTYNDPFTQMEYLNLVFENNWNGGYVYGLGMVGKYDNVVCDKSGSSYTWSGASYSSNVYMPVYGYGQYNMLPEVVVTVDCPSSYQSYSFRQSQNTPTRGVDIFFDNSALTNYQIAALTADANTLHGISNSAIEQVAKQFGDLKGLAKCINAAGKLCAGVSIVVTTIDMFDGHRTPQDWGQLISAGIGIAGVVVGAVSAPIWLPYAIAVSGIVATVVTYTLDDSADQKR